MAVYLGRDKVKINLDGEYFYINLFTKRLITDGVLLLSSDNYTLQDVNGIYLTAKESE